MSRTSEQRKCEDAFAKGVIDGRESNILDRFCQSIAKDLCFFCFFKYFVEAIFSYVTKDEARKRFKFDGCIEGEKPRRFIHDSEIFM